MIRKGRKILALSLMMILMISQVAYAKADQAGSDDGAGTEASQENGREQGQERKQLRMLTGVQNFSQVRVRVNGETVKFDTPPVLKLGEYRTMIPVRAVTEALKCMVYWANPYAVIVNPDEDMLIVFDLQDNPAENTFVFEDVEAIIAGLELNELLSDEITEEAEAEIVSEIENLLDGKDAEEVDVPPGLINNRTFVPLRFIAETFELRVGYNKENMTIDIDGDPVIWKPVVEKTVGSAADVNVNVRENGDKLIGIEESFGDKAELEFDVEYTTSTALSPKFDTKVTILNDYFDEFEPGEYEFKFVFESFGDMIFKLIINEVEDDEAIDWRLIQGFMCSN